MTERWDVSDLQYFESGYIVPGYIGQTRVLFDVRQTVISQYANSPTILRLVDLYNDWMDQTEYFIQFYRNIWNIATAKGFGLDILGKIVGISRRVTVISPQEYFGYNEGGDYQPFDQAPFYNGPVTGDTIALTDDAYRVLIMVKAMANIASTAAPTLNQLLTRLFAGRGRCYVVDLGGMAMKYVFEFALTAVELSILINSNALPSPVGVKVTFEYPGM